MYNKKLWAVFLVVFLLVIPCVSSAQQGDAFSPVATFGGGRPRGPENMLGWDVLVSPQIVVWLGDEGWQANEGQIISELMTLNPFLDAVEIEEQNGKVTLLLSRRTGQGKEELTIETDPAALAASDAGKSKPIDEFDMNSWLQVQSQPVITHVVNVSDANQTLWKIACVTETAVLQQGAGADKKKQKKAEPQGWFQRVIVNSSLVQNFRKGGLIMYFILLCSIVGIYITIDRAIELRRKNLIAPTFLEGVLTRLPDKTIPHQEREGIIHGLVRYCEEHDKPIARTLKAGLFVFEEGILGVKSAIMSSNHHEAANLGKSLGLLEVLANIAPLLGLLGTVTGMIKAFEMISMGGTGRPEVVASGISEALITTAGGLFVGIPLLVCFHLLESKIESTMIEIEEFSLDVVERLIRAKEHEKECQ